MTPLRAGGLADLPRSARISTQRGRTSSFWQFLALWEPSQPSWCEDREDDDEEEEGGAREVAGTYRTMCVRLCDGYYFPISFTTTRERSRKGCEDL